MISEHSGAINLERKCGCNISRNSGAASKDVTFGSRKLLIHGSIISIIKFSLVLSIFK
jgi:hypothetical protein